MSTPHCLDGAFEVLRSHTRRRLLTVLRNRETAKVATLTSRLGGDTVTCVETHHVHLPILDDHGFVEWNRRANEVSRGPRFEEFEQFLDTELAQRTKP